MSLALITFLLVAAGVGGTIGFGAYYRSEIYRRRVETGLADFFGLPMDVGSVRPHSFTARVLSDVRLWLPDRRDRVFFCPRVVWDTAGSGQGTGTLVLIQNPVLSIGSEAWRPEDYVQVLRAGLKHDFRELDIHEARLEWARIMWPRQDFRLIADEVQGRIVFDDQGRGDVRLTCRNLNGTNVTEPVQILARLDPHTEDFLPEVILTVPSIPLATLELDQLLGSSVTQGVFSGRVALRRSAAGEWVEVSGAVREVKLEELTRRTARGPVAAVIDLKIDDAVIRERHLEKLVFSGDIRHLAIDALLSQAGREPVGGVVDLAVHSGRVTDEQIEHLALTGEWAGGSLDALARLALGHGGVHGQLKVKVNSLIVENGEVLRGNIDVSARPAPGQKGTIETRLLLDVLKDRVGLKVPRRLLPESIEYVQMSAKVLIDGRRVRVLSSGGSAGPPVITARLLGQDVPLVAELDESFDLEPLLRELRERISQWKARVRTRIESTTGSRPGGT